MKIAIIGAMEQEIRLLRKQIDIEHILIRGNYKIYYGKFNQLDIILLKSGIGKVSTAIGTTLLIEYFTPKFIINIGSAGGLIPTLHIGDIVISTYICYHDVDITAFNYQPGQMAHCPTKFNASKKLIKLAKESVKTLNLHAVFGLICSGDSFINNAQTIAYIQHTFPEAIAIEMESAAIAHVCHQFNVPFVIVRAISDLVNKKSHLSFKNSLPIATHQSSLVVQTMLGKLTSY